LSKNRSFSDTSVGRYSLALYELAQENGIVNEVEKQSTALLKLIINSKEFDYFIKNPTNAKLEQQKTILEIGNKFKLNQLLVNFMCFLISKRRFYFIKQILKDFLETCSKKRGEIKAQLIAAKNISNEEIDKIKDDLIKSFGSKINLNFKNDPTLIGGLILQVGSVMIDSSIKNKLQKIENQMLEV
tara:strand:- start:330 stop:887 length:558 start_codon:yes stop_codon:yes gene_type:complete